MTAHGLAYDKRKLRELEDRRDHVQQVHDKEKKLRDDIKSGRRAASMAKATAVNQAFHEAEDELHKLTKEIVHLKKMIEREEHEHGR